jgi:gas vesicle protein
MPLPLLIGAAVISAAYGAYKGVSGAMDHSDASDTNDEARFIVRDARQELDKQREATNATLTDYGERKLRAFNGTIEDFIKTFSRLKNVDTINTPELDKLSLGDFTTVSLAGLRHDYDALQDAGLGLGAGLGSGAALAFGAYNGTMLLATASTGTAISGLSGVAATNATLAWLGGGTLASGGMGMAGGMMVLGGIVAGPALAIFGHIVGNSGETALHDARSNKEKAQTFSREAKLSRDKLLAIQQVSALANNTFSKLSGRLRRAVGDMKTAIDTHGEDYQALPSDGREAVFRAVKFAQLVKAMIDTAILDEDGKLVLSTEKRVTEIAALVV